MHPWMESMFCTMIDHEINQFREAERQRNMKKASKKVCKYSNKGIYAGITVLCINFCAIHPEIGCCEDCVNFSHCTTECKTARSAEKTKNCSLT